MKAFVAAALLALAASASAQALEDVMTRPARQLDQPAKAALLDVTRAGTRLVAVGARGVVLLSDDEGASWRQVNVPASVTLTRVQFVNARSGWTVGHFGTVLHTEDGGESWTPQFNGRRAAKLTLDYFEGKAATPGPDAEALAQQVTAAQQLVDDGPDKPFLDLCFENETTGFIVGAYNLIFRTEDGGQTWTPWQDRVANPQGLHLYAIRKVGADWYLAGEQGLLLRSTDGAQHFAPLASPYAGSYFGLIAGNDGELVAFGLRGNVFRSVDQGTRWQQIAMPVPASLYAGAALHDGSLILLDQLGQVLLSRDHGVSFAPVPGVAPSLYTGLAAAGGAVVLSGMRGIVRVPLSSSAKRGN